MSFSLPYPSTPQNGQSGDAVPILANFTALSQGINSFDGSQIQANSVTETALANAVNPRLRDSEELNNFVYAGCTWSVVSGLQGTMTGGTIYVNGYRVIVSGVGAQSFTALQDIYVDIDQNGNVTYPSVSNNATAPALTANSLRVAKIVTDAGAITSIVQSGADSRFNLIYPPTPQQTTQLLNPCKFSVWASTASGNTVATKIPYNNEEFDTGNNFDNVTNFQFTAPVAGFYSFIANQHISDFSTATSATLQLYKNGSSWKSTQIASPGSTTPDINIQAIISLAANDTVAVYYHSTGHSTGVVCGQTNAYFMGWLISRY